jgi:hypothetical protein
VQTLAFADDSSPAHFLGGFQVTRSVYKDLEKIVDGVQEREGRRLARARRGALLRHRALLPHGLQREPRPELDPRAREASMPKLAKGASVADVGCGHGASTIVMAQGLSGVPFIGFDYHEPSVAAAAPRGEGGSGRPREVREGRGEVLSGHGLRPGVHLRCAARHG